MQLGNLRGELEGLPPFNLQHLINPQQQQQPDASEAWQQHLQLPLPPANATYTHPRQLHIQQHDHLQQQQQGQQDLASGGSNLLQYDPILWRAYQVLSFLSHVRHFSW